MWYKLTWMYIWQQKIRPSGWGGWQPWANTLGYWKLNWDVKDYSGNNRDGTLYNGNWLTENNRQYLQWTWSRNDRSWAYVQLPIISVSQFTACLWVKKTWTNSDYWALFGIYPSASTSKIGIIAGNNKYYWSNVAHGSSLDDVGYPTTIENWWHMITWVVSDWLQKLYFDTTLKDTKTYTWINFSNSNTYNWYINANEEDGQTLAIAYWDVILENAIWDNNKVTEVYNLLKWDYWIS